MLAYYAEGAVGVARNASALVAAWRGEHARAVVLDPDVGPASAAHPNSTVLKVGEVVYHQVLMPNTVFLA